jgi:hypothetical protein
MEYNQRITEMGPYLVGSSGCCAGTRDFLSHLGCPSQYSTKYLFLIAHFFSFCVPIAQQPRQAVVPGRRLSLNMCLWIYCLVLSCIRAFFYISFLPFPLFSKHITEQLFKLIDFSK